MQNKLRLSPEIAIEMLQEGNAHFLRGELRRPQLGAALVAAHADRQKPFAVVLACADSRVSPELVFDCGIGDIFVIRTAGNVVDPTVIASVEYAVEYLGSPLVVVMGHTRCGAVISAVNDDPVVGSIYQILARIRPAVTSVKASRPDLSGEALVDEVARVNVLNGINDLLNGSPVLRLAADTGKVRVAGTMYDVANGRVSWLDADLAEAALSAGAKTIS